MTYASAVTADSPLIWWRFDDASGTTAADGSGNSRPGTYNGTFTLGGSSAITSDAASKSVALDGSTAYIASTYAAFAAGGSRSFECWVKRTNHTNRHPVLASAGGNTMLALASGSQDVNFFPDTSTVSTNWTAALPGDNQWVHLVLLFNDSAHTAELYVNGVSKGQNTGIVAQAAAGNINVGARGVDFFLGSLDEFAVYSGLLSGARILAHYQAAVLQSVTAADSVTATDAVIRSVLLPRTAADTTTVTASLLSSYGHLRTTSNTVTTTDAATRSANVARTPVPVVSVGGTPFTTRVSAVRAGDVQRAGSTSYSDSVAVTESSPSIPAVANVTDIVATADIPTRTVSAHAAVSEPSTVTDTAAGGLTDARTVGDTAAVNDSAARGVARTAGVADTVGVTVTVGVAAAGYRNTTDSVTTAEVVVRLLVLQRTAADTASVADDAFRAATAARTAAASVTAVENVHSVQGVHSPAGVVAPSSQAGRVSPTAVEGEV